jgi:hypothetical protein
MLLYQISRPLAYLLVRGAGKFALDWAIPIGLGVLSSLFLYSLPEHPQLYLANGLFSQLGSLLQNLPGFYIAALAAIAVFQREGFDMPLPTPAPTLRIRVGAKWMTIELTRRRLLTVLFGYLSALSFLLYLMIVFVNAVAPTASRLAGSQKAIFGCIGAFAVMTLFGHLLCVTAFGLYQLSDRIFQPDQVRQQPGMEPRPPPN